jgi:hypothetical protein
VTDVAGKPVKLRLYSRPGCHLCEVMRDDVDRILADKPREWEVIDVDSQPGLAARYGESIPVLFVNGRLFAKVRLPRLAGRVRLMKATERIED